MATREWSETVLPDDYVKKVRAAFEQQENEAALVGLGPAGSMDTRRVLYRGAKLLAETPTTSPAAASAKELTVRIKGVGDGVVMPFNHSFRGRAPIAGVDSRRIGLCFGALSTFSRYPPPKNLLLYWKTDDVFTVPREPIACAQALSVRYTVERARALFGSLEMYAKSDGESADDDFCYSPFQPTTKTLPEETIETLRKLRARVDEVCAWKESVAPPTLTPALCAEVAAAAKKEYGWPEEGPVVMVPAEELFRTVTDKELVAALAETLMKRQDCSLCPTSEMGIVLAEAEDADIADLRVIYGHPFC